LKSNRVNRSSMKRTRSAQSRGCVRSSQVSVPSPERKRTRGGLSTQRHPQERWKLERKVHGRVIMARMDTNALLCNRGRPCMVPERGFIERPNAGIQERGSRGITGRTGKAGAMPCKESDRPIVARKGGNSPRAKGSWSGKSEGQMQDNMDLTERPERL
jgi:hypothetical protein